MTRQQATWCFTQNNPKADPVFDPKTMHYLLFGREVAPTTGTPHNQGFVHWRRSTRLAACRKWLPDTKFIPCDGSPEQNEAYCKKTGDFVEFGEIPLPGKNKIDWAAIYLAAKEGRFSDIPDGIRFRSYRTIKEIAKDHLKPIPSIPVLANRWYWGSTGTGKSRTAREEFPDAYIKSATKWWDGYDNQDVVIIEDLEPSDMKSLQQHLKIWGDHYDFPAEIKGGMIRIRPKIIIVTSNYSIEGICDDARTIEPLRRRYNEKQF